MAPKKHLVLIFAFMLVAICSFGQVANMFNGTLNVYVSAQTAPNTFSFTGFYNHCTTKYASEQSQIGDLIFLTDGVEVVAGTITSISSNSSNLITGVMTGAFTSPPLGVGLIARPTPTKSYPVEGCGVPENIQTAVQNYFAILVDQFTGASPGVAVPMDRVAFGGGSNELTTSARFKYSNFRLGLDINPTVTLDVLSQESSAASVVRIGTNQTTTPSAIQVLDNAGGDQLLLGYGPSAIPQIALRNKIFFAGAGRTMYIGTNRSTASILLLEETPGDPLRIGFGTNTVATGSSFDINVAGPVTFPRLTGDPGSSPDGSFYYNTSLNRFRYKTSGLWQPLQNFYVEDATLFSNRIVSGGGQTLQFGTSTSDLLKFKLFSDSVRFNLNDFYLRVPNTEGGFDYLSFGNDDILIEKTHNGGANGFNVSVAETSLFTANTALGDLNIVAARPTSILFSGTDNGVAYEYTFPTVSPGTGIKILQWNNGTPSFVSSGSLGQNIANTNLTLTATRTLSGGGFNLTLGSSTSDLPFFTVNSNVATFAGQQFGVNSTDGPITLNALSSTNTGAQLYLSGGTARLYSENTAANNRVELELFPTKFEVKGLNTGSAWGYELPRASPGTGNKIMQWSNGTPSFVNTPQNGIYGGSGVLQPGYTSIAFDPDENHAFYIDNDPGFKGFGYYLGGNDNYDSEVNSSNSAQANSFALSAVGGSRATISGNGIGSYIQYSVTKARDFSLKAGTIRFYLSEGSPTNKILGFEAVIDSVNNKHASLVRARFRSPLLNQIGESSHIAGFARGVEENGFDFRFKSVIPRYLIQSSFTATLGGNTYFDWIRVNLDIDTTGNHIQFYNGKYAFPNASPGSGNRMIEWQNGVPTWINTPSGGGGSVSAPTGQVVFGTGSSVTSSANLFWDNTNGRLGINTGTPGARLSVVENAVAGVMNLRNNANNGYVSVDFITHTGATAIASFGVGNPSVGALAGVFYLNTNNANQTFSTNNGVNSLIFLQHANQRVGINTSSPSYTLDVAGGNGVRISNLGADPTGASGAFYYSTATSTFRMHNGTSWGGFVRAPQNRIVFGNSTGTDVTNEAAYYVADYASGANKRIGVDATNSGFEFKNGGNTSWTIASYQGNVTGNLDYVWWNEQAPVQSHAFFINGDNNNIGFGTTSPRSRFEVSNTVANLQAITVQATQANGYSSIAFFNNSNVLGSHFGYGNPSAGATWTRNRTFLSSSSSDIIFSTNDGASALAFFQHSTQRVGINTSSPAYTLDVAGTAEFGTNALTRGVIFDDVTRDWRISNTFGDKTARIRVIDDQVQLSSSDGVSPGLSSTLTITSLGTRFSAPNHFYTNVEAARAAAIPDGTLYYVVGEDDLKIKTSSTSSSAVPQARVTVSSGTTVTFTGFNVNTYWDNTRIEIYRNGVLLEEGASFDYEISSKTPLTLTLPSAVGTSTVFRVRVITSQ